MPSRPLVVVDPGHGGTDPGAVNAAGVREADLNLSLAELFRQAAQCDGTYDVVLLRDSDRFISLADRAFMANEAGADVVLSFHCNAFQSAIVRGYEVWTTPGVTKADSLSTHIYNLLNVAIPYCGRPDFDDGDPDKEAQFFILRHTIAPAVLIEFGYMTNHGDAVWLAESKNRALAAAAVELAVRSWLIGLPS